MERLCSKVSGDIGYIFLFTFYRLIFKYPHLTVPMKVSQITNSLIRISGLVPLKFSGIWVPQHWEMCIQCCISHPVLWKPKLNIFLEKPIYSGKHNALNLLVQFMNLFRIYVSTDMCVYMQCLYGKGITKIIQGNKLLLSIKATFNRTCPLFTELLKVIEIFFPQDTELCDEKTAQNSPTQFTLHYTSCWWDLLWWAFIFTKQTPKQKSRPRCWICLEQELNSECVSKKIIFSSVIN